MFVRVEIPEKYYKYINEGDHVKVRVPGKTDRVLSGNIKGVEFCFENKKTTRFGGGIYSGHENLGETVFYARIVLEKQKEGHELKPGTVADVYFNFDNP